jgi:hypothetical protein
MESVLNRCEDVDKGGKRTVFIRSTLFWRQGLSEVVREQTYPGIQYCFQEESRFVKEKGITGKAGHWQCIW